MIKVFEAINVREAHLLKAYLEVKGVVSEVRGGAEHAVRGELALWPGLLPSIWVRDAEAELAQDLVREFSKGPHPESLGEPWHCLSCGEVHEPQFLSCWKCGTAKPHQSGIGGE